MRVRDGVRSSWLKAFGLVKGVSSGIWCFVLISDGTNGFSKGQPLSYDLGGSL